MMLANQESLDRVAWIMAVLDFRDAAQESADSCGEPSIEVRRFAWQLGAMADFATGLLAVEAK